MVAVGQAVAASVVAQVGYGKPQIGETAVVGVYKQGHDVCLWCGLAAAWVFVVFRLPLLWMVLCGGSFQAA